MRYTFKKYERLKREQHITTLFHTGKAFSVFPLRVIYHIVDRGAEAAPVRIGFSAPKKKFRRSVDRHRIQRLMREAWRLNKHTLYEAMPVEMHLHIFFIFTGKEMPGHVQVQDAAIMCIERLISITKPVTGDE